MILSYILKTVRYINMTASRIVAQSDYMFDFKIKVEHYAFYLLKDFALYFEDY